MRVAHVLGLAVILALGAAATAQARTGSSGWAPIQSPSAPKPPKAPGAPASPQFKPYKGSSTYEHRAGQQPYQHGPQPKPYGTSVFGPDKKKR
jgi:hypothetical protein